MLHLALTGDELGAAAGLLISLPWRPKESRERCFQAGIFSVCLLHVSMGLQCVLC